jgi:hypothetical protein
MVHLKLLNHSKCDTIEAVEAYFVVGHIDVIALVSRPKVADFSTLPSLIGDRAIPSDSLGVEIHTKSRANSPREAKLPATANASVFPLQYLRILSMHLRNCLVSIPIRHRYGDLGQ